MSVLDIDIPTLVETSSDSDGTPEYDVVPEDHKFNIRVLGDEPKYFAYVLKKGIELPCKKKIQGKFYFDTLEMLFILMLFFHRSSIHIFQKLVSFYV